MPTEEHRSLGINFNGSWIKPLGSDFQKISGPDFLVLGSYNEGQIFIRAQLPFKHLNKGQIFISIQRPAVPMARFSKRAKHPMCIQPGELLKIWPFIVVPKWELSSFENLGLAEGAEPFSNGWSECPKCARHCTRSWQDC